MIFDASLIVRTIILANLGLSTLAEIVPRAGGGSSGGGGRGGGSGSGSGGKSSSGGNRGNSKPGHANGVTGGKLSGLRRFPNPRIEEEGHIIEDDASSVFSIGSFGEDEQVLFENFEGATLPFFSKMYDFFYAKETYLHTEDAYAEASGEKNPFPKGKSSRPTGSRLTFRAAVGSDPDDRRTITSTWNPAEPTDSCYQWSSLHKYCEGAGTECACSSSRFYVPDQYNSIAADCARVTTKCSDDEDAEATDVAWCEIGQSAASYSNYCNEDKKTVKFAATADVDASETTSPPSGPNEGPPPSDPGDEPKPEYTFTSTSDEIPSSTGTDMMDATTTPNSYTASYSPTESVDICTLSLVDNTPEETRSFVSSYCQHRQPSPTGWSSRLTSPLSMNAISFAFFLLVILNM